MYACRMPPTTKISEVVRRATIEATRSDANFNQLDLARQLKIDPATLSRFLNGKSIRLAHLDAIAKAVGVEAIQRGGR